MVGSDEEKILFYLHKMTNGTWKKGGIPELWDGKSGKRIVNCIAQFSK